MVQFLLIVPSYLNNKKLRNIDFTTFLSYYRARDGARGPVDLGLRGPKRSVDLEREGRKARKRSKERRFGHLQFIS